MPTVAREATMTDELRACLALSLAHVGGAQLESLYAAHGSAAGVLAAGDTELARHGLSADRIRALRRPDAALLEAAVTWAEVDGHHLVVAGSDDYPPLLRQVRDWPPLLYVNGNPGALQLPALAIIGSRNPTRGGLDTARGFAAHLANCGFVIVSGLAQGIDTAAHEGALAAPGRTVAVLGHGIDRVYPAANRDLAHRIAADGALVSEYPLGTPPRPEHFPARNRLLSGLALGTLVVEAARRSGSLITARLAAEQGREVFAIPGSIHNALARGCHRLIRDGAKLVESADDIIAELGPLVGHLREQQAAPAAVPREAVKRDRDYDKLLDAMGFDAVSADEIASRSGLTIEQVSSMLLILELEGDIEVLQGGRYSRLLPG